MLVLGGGSEIGAAFVEACIDEGLDTVVLAGRAGGSVDSASARLLADHPDVAVEVAGFDAGQVDHQAVAISTLDQRHGPFDTIVIAFGLLGTPFNLDVAPAEAAQVAHVNYTAAVAACLASVGVLRGRPNARLIVLSSIAAVRPRLGNLVYSSAKAGLDAFVTGVRPAAEELGVDVVAVRPGFVHSRMTEGLNPAPFATGPAEVAVDMVAGLRDRKSVIHSPNVLGPVGRLLRVLPAPLWRRISDR